jgi:hypothetical protein
MEQPQDRYGAVYMLIYALITGTGTVSVYTSVDFAMKFVSFCFTITVSIFAIRYYNKSMNKLDK